MLDVQVDFAAGSMFDPEGKSGLAALTRALLDLGRASWMKRDRRATGRHRRHAWAAAPTPTAPASRCARCRPATSASRRSSSCGWCSSSRLSRRHLRAREGAHHRRPQGGDDTGPDSIAASASGRAVSRPPLRPASRRRKAWRASGATTSSPSTPATTRRQRAASSRWSATSRAAKPRALAERLDREPARRGRCTSCRPPETALPAGTPCASTTRPSRRTSTSACRRSKRGDPDFFPLLVGNYTLGGGGFVSRLMKEVRDKRGYAYSVYSYFSRSAEPAPSRSACRPSAQAKDALKVVREVLAGFLADGPSEAELKAAKANLTGSFPAAPRQQPQDDRQRRGDRLLRPAARLSRRYPRQKSKRSRPPTSARPLPATSGRSTWSRLSSPWRAVELGAHRRRRVAAPPLAFPTRRACGRRRTRARDAVQLAGPGSRRLALPRPLRRQRGARLRGGFARRGAVVMVEQRRGASPRCAKMPPLLNRRDVEIVRADALKFASSTATSALRCAVPRSALQAGLDCPPGAPAAATAGSRRRASTSRRNTRNRIACGDWRRAVRSGRGGAGLLSLLRSEQQA
jgi:zinc protease